MRGMFLMWNVLHHPKNGFQKRNINYSSSRCSECNEEEVACQDRTINRVEKQREAILQARETGRKKRKTDGSKERKKTILLECRKISAQFLFPGVFTEAEWKTLERGDRRLLDWRVIPLMTDQAYSKRTKKPTTARSVGRSVLKSGHGWVTVPVSAAAAVQSRTRLCFQENELTIWNKRDPSAASQSPAS